MSLGVPRLAWAAGAFVVWRLARSAPSSRWCGRLAPRATIVQGGEVAGSSRRPRADEAAPLAGNPAAHRRTRRRPRCANTFSNHRCLPRMRERSRSRPSPPCSRRPKPRIHPIDHAFNCPRGPGGTRWIADQAGEQTIILVFDSPQTIRQVSLEVEEKDVDRTQELALSVSSWRPSLSGAPPTRVHLQPRRRHLRTGGVDDLRAGRDPGESRDQARQGRQELSSGLDLPCLHGLTLLYCRAAFAHRLVAASAG
jgi:hypothetical protein